MMTVIETSCRPKIHPLMVILVAIILATRTKDTTGMAKENTTEADKVVVVVAPAVGTYN